MTECQKPGFGEIYAGLHFKSRSVVDLDHRATLVARGQPSWGMTSDGEEKGNGGGGNVFKIWSGLVHVRAK